MVRLREFFKTYRWALLSGILMGTSYVPFPPWALIFCWVPLWLDLAHENSLKRVFWKAWWAQFALSLIGFHWIAYVSHEFGYLPWPVAIVVLLGFCAGIHLYIPLACMAAKYMSQRLQLSAGGFFVLAACAHSLGEIWWPAIFPWNLGYPLLWSGVPVAQFMDVIGALGLSFLVHLINAGIATLWRRREARLTWAAGSAFVIFVALFSWWGLQRSDAWKGGDKNLRVLMVQGNIGNLEKVMAEKGAGFQREITQRYFRLTRQALQQNLLNGGAPVDLIVWPESAYPDFLGNHNHFRFYSSQFEDFVRDIQTPIITGSYANDPPEAAERRDYNGMFLYGRDSVAQSPAYHKTYLLIFGEYVPFGEMFPVLKRLNPGGPGFGRGSGPVIWNYEGLRVGPQICYESLYPDFSEALVKKGAQILVNLTNDSWFGPGFEPRQHMIMTLARGVESRRPLLRSTNTGITTAILADGQILTRSPLFTEWAHVFEIPYRENPSLTFYTQWGSFLPGVVILVAVLGAALNLYLLRKRT